MAEPTLKDVLNAVATLTREVTTLKTATKADFVALDEKLDSVRTELITKIATARVELRDELAAHIQAVGNGRTAEAIRGLENDVETLKKEVAALKGRPPARPARRR